jgi:multidrug transporter EmrE-like cation transporter
MGFSTLPWYLVAAACSAAPVVLVKKYTESNNSNLLLLSLLSQCVLIYSYSVILHDKNITVIYPLIKILAILIVALCGFLLFGNKFSVKWILGICFGFLSIYLLTNK